MKYISEVTSFGKSFLLTFQIVTEQNCSKPGKWGNTWLDTHDS